MTELFELDRLAALAQQPLDEQTAIEVRRLVTSAVSRAIGYNPTAGTHDWTGQVAYDDWVTLPRGPVGAITSLAVLGDDGVEYPLNVGGNGYYVVGRRLYLVGRRTDIGWPYRVHVVYAYGSDDPEWLEAAREIAMRAAVRLYSNPSSERSENVGSYSHTSGVDELDTVLTRNEKRELRATYGPGAAYSVPVVR